MDTYTTYAKNTRHMLRICQLHRLQRSKIPPPKKEGVLGMILNCIQGKAPVLKLWKV